MQDDIPDIPTTNTLQDEWRALQKAFSFARGFKLFLIHCEPTLAPLIAEYLLLAHPDPDPVILSLGKPIDNLFLKMEEMISMGKTAPILVTDLSFSMNDPDCWEALVSNLNVTRDRFVKHFPSPLVLFFDSEPLGELARGAPDFFSIRSGLFSFRGEDALHFFGNLEENEKAIANLDVKQHLAFLFRAHGFQFKRTWPNDFPGIDGVARFGEDACYVVVEVSENPVEKKMVQSLSMQYHMGRSPLPIIIFSESGFTSEAEEAVKEQNVGVFFLINHFPTFFEEWANGSRSLIQSQFPESHGSSRPSIDSSEPGLEQLTAYFDTLLAGVEERIHKLDTPEEGRSIEVLILDIENKVLQVQKDLLNRGPLDGKSSVLTNNLLSATNQALKQLRLKMSGPNNKADVEYLDQVLNYSDMQALKGNYHFTDGVTPADLKRFAAMYQRRKGQIDEILMASSINSPETPMNLRGQITPHTLHKYMESRTIPLRLKTQILFYFEKALQSEAAYLVLSLNYVKPSSLQNTSFYKTQLAMMEQAIGANPDLKKELRKIWSFFSHHLKTYQPTRFKTNYRRNKKTFETDVSNAIGNRFG